MQVDLLEELDNANSDKELFDAASKIVVVPKVQGETFEDRSFILHAPLELCARYFLLPLVDDTHVQSARAQIRRLARRYHDYENAEVKIADVPFNPLTIDVNKWSSTLLFASHPSILLALHTLLGDTNEEIHNVLARFDYDIMTSPSEQLKFVIQGIEPKELTAELVAHPEDFFIDHVGNIEQIMGETDTIKGLVCTAQNSGLLDDLISKIEGIASFSSRSDFDIPFKILLRIAVLSMVIEENDHAKYGWTHCATIPHSHWALNQIGDSGYLIKSAATFVSAFRSLMGTHKISKEDFEPYYEEDEESVFAEHYVRMTDIISRACTLEDGHLVKHVYTCFDLMKRDPQYSKLYIEASSKLLGIWEN